VPNHRQRERLQFDPGLASKCGRARGRQAVIPSGTSVAIVAGMRSSVLVSFAVSALFCAVAVPARAQEAAPDVPASNTAPIAPAPGSVPVVHAPAAAMSTDAAQAVAPRKRWYGWQTLTTDAASITLIAAGVSSHSDMVVFTGIAGLAVAPGVIHLAHGNYAYSGASVAMRAAGVPLAAGAGYLIGHSACSPASNDKDVPCEAITANVGLLGAAVFAIVLDSAILGYDSGSKDEDSAKTQARRDSAALHVMPSLSFSHERSMLTLSGDF
jgi:hypothetical protein